MKKYIINKWWVLSIVALTILSCKKDFLDRQPLDALSTANPLASTNELRLYVNQFYSILPGQPTGVGGTGIAFNDAGTDNLIFSSVNTRLTGQSALSNAASISEYTTIRSLNYFIANYKNAKGDDNLINQYLGEVRFFRAMCYFNIVKKYGDVTWVNKVLPDDPAAMQVPRDPRPLVIDSVLADLDIAAQLLPVASSSASMRLHKDVALAFKSRVALYEGTWQKYHKAKGDVFYTSSITDAKIQNYLEQARDAALSVINGGRWRIYNTAKPLQDYSDLFITYDLSSNPEAMLWRKYNTNDNIGQSISKYTSTDGADMGIVLSLVDDYLTQDGKPFSGEARNTAQKIYGTEFTSSIRDPRLSQTVCIPGQPLRPVNVVVPAYPPIDQTGFSRSTTGFPLHKYLEYASAAAVSDDYKSMAPAIEFRYAEILLNYAEAMAELGGDQSLIANALKPLRDRVGMPMVDFTREYNTDTNYPFRNLTPVIQAVRRERRVELACEGFRVDDILRWAAADILLAGKRPLGALFVGSDMAAQDVPGGFYNGSLYYDTAPAGILRWAAADILLAGKRPLGALFVGSDMAAQDVPGGFYNGSLYYDTAPAGKSVNLYLTGTQGDAMRYIDPYKNVLPSGYLFNINRDYLLPIQQRMLQLTGNKWVQNPGW